MPESGRPGTRSSIEVVPGTARCGYYERKPHKSQELRTWPRSPTLSFFESWEVTADSGKRSSCLPDLYPLSICVVIPASAFIRPDGFEIRVDLLYTLENE